MGVSLTLIPMLPSCWSWWVLGRKKDKDTNTKRMGRGHCPEPKMSALQCQGPDFWPASASTWTAHLLGAPLPFCNLLRVQVQRTLLPGPTWSGLSAQGWLLCQETYFSELVSAMLALPVRPTSYIWAVVQQYKHRSIILF